jgi:hypothetical protein
MSGLIKGMSKSLREAISKGIRNDFMKIVKELTSPVHWEKLVTDAIFPSIDP